MELINNATVQYAGTLLDKEHAREVELGVVGVLVLKLDNDCGFLESVKDFLAVLKRVPGVVWRTVWRFLLNAVRERPQTVSDIRTRTYLVLRQKK